MARPTVEITQQFTFEAAHYLGEAPTDSNRRIHGHSFHVEVTLRGQPDSTQGWVRDFAEINESLVAIRNTLDHGLLNELPDLGIPTLENLSRFIFHEARRRMPEVCRVRLSRPSLGQSCTYEEI